MVDQLEWLQTLSQLPGWALKHDLDQFVLDELTQNLTNDAQVGYLEDTRKMSFRQRGWRSADLRHGVRKGGHESCCRTATSRRSVGGRSGRGSRVLKSVGDVRGGPHQPRAACR